VGAATSEAAEATLEVAAWGAVIAEGLAEAILAALVEATSEAVAGAVIAEGLAEAILAASVGAILVDRTSAEAMLAA